jgi:AcrR family transcriptional regulator
MAGGAPPAERADALRNRRKILAAAAEVAGREGWAAMTVEDVAKAAGVGVGTIYRRFTDRAGLLGALVNDRELELQQAFLSGPPPLGPGAPPAERIRAFLHALVDRFGEQRELLLSLETRGARIAPRSVHHTHLAMLIRQARPAADAEFLASALLAAVSARTLQAHQRDSGRSLAQVKAGVDDLLAGVTPVAGSQAP